MDNITKIDEAMKQESGYTDADAAENKTSEFPALVVDDGTITVPIKNKQGQLVGKFTFSPTDVRMVDRFNEVAEEFEKIVEPLEHINISPDGSADDADAAATAAMREAEQRLYKNCDYMFGGNMSEAFFGKVHPFSPVGEKFYCEIVLDAVGNLISQQFDRATKKINRRMARYTHGVNTRTGKHKSNKR